MFYKNNFREGNSFLHRVHPVIKFLGFLMIIFLLFARISVFIHLSLILLTIIIAYFSKSWKFIGKKIMVVYVSFFFFLLMVNWVFNKNPGFWDANHVSKNYIDLFSARLNSSNIGTGNNVQHGWFWGGQVVTKSNETNIYAADSIACIKKIGNVAQNTCSDTKLNANSDYSGTSMKFFGIVDQAGAIKYVGFYPKWYTITALQFLTAWNMTNKIILVIILSSFLTITTRLTDLSYALEDIFKPLKIFKLPAEEMALIIALAIRFIPSMMVETFKIMKAQACRGIDFKNGKFKDKWIAITALFIPLFIISIIKSDELSTAMIARAYKPRNCRTSYRTHGLNTESVIVTSVFVFSVALLYFLHFHNFYCSHFGALEYLLLIAK